MDIRPFRGWRYDVSGGQDIGGLVAPPYDILSAADKQALLARDAHNIVAVDLPHVPPKEVGPDSAYQAAAALLGQWQRSGVLRQDDQPSLYAYRQTFTWTGRTYNRRALLAGVRATELGKDVIPHEHTFAGPKADRLKLTQCTAMQLSPIFGFYSNAPAAAEALWNAAASTTPVHGQLGQVGETLWAISDPQAIAEVVAALRPVPVFIADGHHRYTTALNYRDALLASGKIDADHEANFVLFALVEQSDPGLLILPTHRIVRGLAADFTVEKLIRATAEFRWQRVQVKAGDLADADSFLRRLGKTAMAFVEAHTGPGTANDAEPVPIWVATLNDPAAMAAAAPDELPAWRDLDVAILHQLIVDRALAGWRTGATAIDYTPDGLGVLEACRTGGAFLGVCLQATPLAAVEKIALAGAVMPHKSTYFYPKLATGWVMKPLTP